jgi:hypothetical protein
LSELRSDALEALGRLHLDQGDDAPARDVARQAIEADPLREEPRRFSMLALYRSGRQVEALRHFGVYQSLLAEELGIEPSDALRDLEKRILLQDLTLHEEIGFLAGVAAALASNNGRVGFVGGADIDVIHQFVAGCEEGVVYVDPSVRVDPIYLTGWNGITFDVDGFCNIILGDAGAEYLRGQGADVIFHAAGSSGWGLMNNSATEAMQGGGYWTIGVDRDQYIEMDVVAGNMG